MCTSEALKLAFRFQYVVHPPIRNSHMQEQRWAGDLTGRGGHSFNPTSALVGLSADPMQAFIDQVLVPVRLRCTGALQKHTRTSRMPLTFRNGKLCALRPQTYVVFLEIRACSDRLGNLAVHFVYRPDVDLSRAWSAAVTPQGLGHLGPSTENDEEFLAYPNGEEEAGMLSHRGHDSGMAGGSRFEPRWPLIRSP
jgi:hypothetical protein